MTDDTQPEAMDLADWLEAVGGGPSAKRCAALLREQHARIAELESELEAMDAGGVQALSAAPRTPTVEQVEDEVSMGHGAWDMVDPQELIGAVLRLSVAASPTPPAEQAAPKAAPGEPFQHRVQPWLLQCFGAEIAADTVERNHRFLEEALELVQSTGCTQSEAHQLVDYVFGRPVGEPAQEVGGVMVTLAALCLANGLDMHNAGEIELARIWTKVEAIRAKQAAKPKHSPLPQAAPQQEAQPNYVVSLVVVKEIPTGVNTQNKLYTVNAASADEAVGKAVLQMPSDFPEHRLHTACFVAAPAQPAPAPPSDDSALLDWIAIHGSFGVDSSTGKVGGNGQKCVAATRKNIRAAIAAQRGNK